MRELPPEVAPALQPQSSTPAVHALNADSAAAIDLCADSFSEEGKSTLDGLAAFDGISKNVCARHRTPKSNWEHPRG